MNFDPDNKITMFACSRIAFLRGVTGSRRSSCDIFNPLYSLEFQFHRLHYRTTFINFVIDFRAFNSGIAGKPGAIPCIPVRRTGQFLATGLPKEARAEEKLE